MKEYASFSQSNIYYSSCQKYDCIYDYDNHYALSF